MNINLTGSLEFLHMVFINCNILTYISSINIWASRDSALAQLLKELFTFVCNPKSVGSRHSRSNQ